MSKSENHWYLLGATAQVSRARSRATSHTVIVWVVLIVLFVGFYQAFQPDAPAVLPLMAQRWWYALPFLFVGMRALTLWRQRRARARYLQALQATTAEPALEDIDQSMQAARAHPDAPALRAMRRSLALAFYGRGEEALRALGEVEWASRAPLIQAVGLIGEYAVALLCARDARRALELARKMLALSEVSAVVPGATRTWRAFELHAAVAEAMLGRVSPQALARLEKGATDRRAPADHLLALLGLACVCEREGDAARAAELRGSLQQLAPHCAPLHLGLEALSTSSAVALPMGPVSLALSQGPASSAGPRPQARAAQRTLLGVFGRLAGLWLLLMVLFVFFYVFFSPR